VNENSKVNRRQLLAMAGLSMTAATAGCAGGNAGETSADETSTPTSSTDDDSEPTEVSTQTRTETATPEQRTPTTPPRLRGIDLSLTGEKVLNFGNQRVTRSFDTSVVTGYQEVEPGELTISVGGSVRVEQTVTIPDRGDYTLALFGGARNEDTPLELRLLDDENDIAPEAPGRVRLINGVPDVGELALTIAGYSGDARVPVEGVGYGEAAYGTFPENDSESSFNVALNDGAPFDMFSMRGLVGTVETVLVTGEVGSGSPRDLNRKITQDV
jgi:hypothetical protein